MTTSKEIAAVRRAARKAASAREELEAAMTEARKAGLPLREVAKAGNVSYETVRRIAG